MLSCEPLFCVPLQVGLETEGFAIYDALMNVRNQVNIIGLH